MNVDDLSCGLSAVFMSRMETSYTHMFGSCSASEPVHEAWWSHLLCNWGSTPMGGGISEQRVHDTWCCCPSPLHMGWGKRHSADMPFLALLLAPILCLQQGSRGAQCLAATAPYCPNTESERALIFQFFSDCTHPSFYITGDAISNKIEDERYRTH